MACKFISIVYQLYQEMKNEMNWTELNLDEYSKRTQIQRISIQYKVIEQS